MCTFMLLVLLFILPQRVIDSYRNQFCTRITLHPLFELCKIRRFSKICIYSKRLRYNFNLNQKKKNKIEEKQMRHSIQEWTK